jgi:hypothetical protein
MLKASVPQPLSERSLRKDQLVVRTKAGHIPSGLPEAFQALGKRSFPAGATLGSCHAFGKSELVVEKERP